MVLLQRVKDYCPSIGGRMAMLACDVLAFIVSLLVVGQTGPNWRQGVTWLSVGMGTLSVGIIARGMYASMFHVKVEGSPPSSEASVPAAAVNDPAAPEPIDRTQPDMRQWGSAEESAAEDQRIMREMSGMWNRPADAMDDARPLTEVEIRSVRRRQPLITDEDRQP